MIITLLILLHITSVNQMGLICVTMQKYQQEWGQFGRDSILTCNESKRKLTIFLSAFTLFKNCSSGFVSKVGL